MREGVGEAKGQKATSSPEEQAIKRAKREHGPRGRIAKMAKLYKKEKLGIRRPSPWEGEV